MTEYNFVGIDMDKDKFDVAVLCNEKLINSTFDNTKQGFRKFHEWIQKKINSAWVCLESTGHYSELIADFLYEQGIRVSVVNPVRIKQFIKLQLVRNKNDIIDARMIREFAEMYKPRTFQPRSHEQKQLRELIQLLDAIKKEKVQISNQMANLQTPLAKIEYRKIIKTLEGKETTEKNKRDCHQRAINEQHNNIFNRNQRHWGAKCL